MIPPTRRLTAQRAERKALVLELHRRGMEPGQIATRVGLMETTVRKHLAAAKLPVHTPKKGGEKVAVAYHARLAAEMDERKSKAIELYGQGMELKQIAGRVGVGERKVRDYLVAANLIVLTPGRGRPKKAKKP